MNIWFSGMASSERSQPGLEAKDITAAAIRYVEKLSLHKKAIIGINFYYTDHTHILTPIVVLSLIVLVRLCLL